VDTRTSTERLEDPLIWWSAVNNLKLKEGTTSGWVMMGQAVSWGPRGNNVRQEREALVNVQRMILNKRCYKKHVTITIEKL
jgi:hypothetical protein